MKHATDETGFHNHHSFDDFLLTFPHCVPPEQRYRQNRKIINLIASKKKTILSFIRSKL